MSATMNSIVSILNDSVQKPCTKVITKRLVAILSDSSPRSYGNGFRKPTKRQVTKYKKAHLNRIYTKRMAHPDIPKKKVKIFKEMDKMFSK